MMFENLFLYVFHLTDLSYCMLLMSGGLLFLSLVLVLRLFIVCRKTSKVSVISEFLKEFAEDRTLILIVILTTVLNLFLLHMKLQTEFSYKDITKYLLGIIYFSSIFSLVVSWLKPYDDVDVAVSQNFRTSIGACWANGAVMAYYEDSLNQFRARAQKFEEDHPNAALLVKKLVLIAPLSCNIEGSLSDRDEKIHHIGDLEPIERDEGANMNRKLITPIYEIYYQNTAIFIAAEYPSPLGTLWGERYGMDEDAKIYIRDCFLKELKEQLKSKPVIILEYDDQNPSNTMPLTEFIISSLRKHFEENNYTDNVLCGKTKNYIINESTNNFVH